MTVSNARLSSFLYLMSLDPFSHGEAVVSHAAHGHEGCFLVKTFTGNSQIALWFKLSIAAEFHSQALEWTSNIAVQLRKSTSLSL